MSRGEYKVTGGKLVAAEVDVSGGVISRASISGDFFLEPDDALAAIDAALTGLPADSTVATMTEAVEGATAGASMVGFTPEAVAIAVRRALGHASNWSEHTFEVVHGDPIPPVLNVALDQVLLEEVGAGRRGPTLRLWEWTSSAVIIGSFQSVRNEVDEEAAAERDVEVIRRISGGGAMFMEPGNTITYSLYVPGSLVDGLSFERSYAFLDDWVLGALATVGIEATYVPLNDISSPAGKIGGAAQKRLAGGAVLHHATMAYDIDADAMSRVLRIGREKLSDKGTKSANKRVDPMRRQTGMTRAEVIAAFTDYFAARYATVPGEITAAEMARARDLVETKFTAPAWRNRVP
ncbi:biotin/lipoate A/B protein ligase family protein [Pseudactinotalea sp. HY158]|uniref:lipoate--protein ligase family protein n=1 Tax=unclassified Pseudactinotalea TaxID=2649176 RepID=UPI00129D1DDF|nr:biotin/lipoate A/B protein ligase family protein [Pseudactinotalea sp. HY158]MPV50367.1 lipoate--protein ligase family protein [Pseudactinotalea sp. HY160]QGH68962.1 lipoate--protein ligase family protein [Pseudactinotalea sp. HY158]